jgi:putative nucleotidyltransferase with HDIG domain
MQSASRPSRVSKPRQNYLELLDLAAKLTGASRAAFLPLDGGKSLQTRGARQNLPLIYWEAAKEVIRNPSPKLFRPPGQRPVAPLLAVPVQHGRLLLGVMIVSDRPHRPLGQEDLNLVALLAENPYLVSRNQVQREKHTVRLMESIQALVRTLEARDHYTGRHSSRVTEIALRFARDLGLPQEELESLKTAAYLHDLGKVGISDRLLLKPGPLTAEERAIIQAHPVIGEKIVSPLNLKPREREIILHHHERWDGTGYPQGLAKEEIPLLCRLVALSDVFDALTSDRPYRQKFSIPEALEEIRAGAGTQFDPDLARRFVKLLSYPTRKSRPRLLT